MNVVRTEMSLPDGSVIYYVYEKKDTYLGVFFRVIIYTNIRKNSSIFVIKEHLFLISVFVSITHFL